LAQVSLLPTQFAKLSCKTKALAGLELHRNVVRLRKRRREQLSKVGVICGHAAPARGVANWGTRS